MQEADTAELSLEKHIPAIIADQRITTMFQPLVSVKQRRVIGFEMLSRGWHPDTGEMIAPDLLFAAAERAGRTLELDRACRRTAFERFSKLDGSRHVLASVNLEVSILNGETVGSNVLLEQVTSNNIDPSQVIIEMLEREIRDANMVLSFVREYRKRGFLIALDDVGAGYSNLDRVALIRPDIIKTDRSLIQGITTSFHRQGLIEALVHLAHKIGALVIAEGVETEDEATVMMQMGADVLQGFLFGRPSDARDIDYQTIRTQMDAAAFDFRRRTIEQTRDRREQFERHGRTVDDAIARLAADRHVDYDRVLERIVSDSPGVECMYVLDDTGIQFTTTIFHDGQSSRTTNRMFGPASPGTDHSNKDYCFYLLAGFPSFTTLPYISLATGQLCVTIARRFIDAENKQRILCTDIRYQA